MCVRAFSCTTVEHRDVVACNPKIGLKFKACQDQSCRFLEQETLSIMLCTSWPQETDP